MPLSVGEPAKQTVCIEVGGICREVAAQGHDHTEKNESQGSTVPLFDDCGSIVIGFGIGQGSAHR